MYLIKQANGLRKLPADLTKTTQFYSEPNKQKSRRIPRAEGGSVLTLCWAASQRVEKQPRMEAARGQGDLILKTFLPKSDFASKAPLKKTTDRPRNPHGEKVRHFATLIVSKTSQYENGTFLSRPFCRKPRPPKP